MTRSIIQIYEILGLTRVDWLYPGSISAFIIIIITIIIILKSREEEIANSSRKGKRPNEQATNACLFYHDQITWS